MLWPIVAGAAIGVPIGVTVLVGANPAHVRAAIGMFLVLYSLYALLRPTMRPVVVGGAVADAGVGFLNGVLPASPGLPEFWSPYGAACAAGRRISSARYSSRSLSPFSP